MATPSRVGSSTPTTFSALSSPSTPITAATVGNRLIVCFANAATRTVNSITDDQTTPGTYTQVIEQNSTTHVGIWISDPITQTGSINVTVNLSSSTSGTILITEVAGLSTTTPNDASSSAINSSASPLLSAAAGLIDTTTDVIVFMVVRPTATVTFTDPTSYTRDGTGNVTGFWYRTSAGALTDQGSTNSTIGVSAARSGPAVIASFKADAAAAGQPFRKRWGGVRHNAYTRGGTW